VSSEDSSHRVEPGAHRLEADALPGEQHTEAEDKSLSELVSDLMTQVTTLFREEVELAKTEVKQEARRMGQASAKLVAAGVTGLIALLLLSLALAWAIALVLPTWAGFFIVGAVYAVVAFGLRAAGREDLRHASVKPEQTVKSLKEDREWLRHQTP
jgi:uncharacterized membrane protein YqjE